MSDWKTRREMINDDNDPDNLCEVKFGGKIRRFKMFALMGFEDGKNPLCITICSPADICFTIEQFKKIYTKSMQESNIFEQTKTLHDIISDMRTISESSVIDLLIDDVLGEVEVDEDVDMEEEEEDQFPELDGGDFDDL